MKYLISIAVLSSILVVTSVKAQHIDAEQLIKTDPPAAVSDKEIQCLAKGIYYESKGEPMKGKIAVAQVILNRVNHPKYPKTICGVVQEKNKYKGKTVCQFSWYCNPGRKITNHKIYNESIEIAKRMIYDELRIPALAKALSFHAVYVSPKWNKKPIKRIGNHIFY